MINRKITTRIGIAALALSAAALVDLGRDEGYIETARQPIPGDVDTNGFGTTTNPDGTPLKRGQKTDPVRALIALGRDASKHEQGFRNCVGGVTLFPWEYDAYVRLTYNVGIGNVCKSSIPAKLRAGQYAAACATIKDFNGQCIERNAAGRCVKKKVIRGLVIRREKEYQRCIGENK